MEWAKRMNDAIAYIETNLDGEVDYAQAAKRAHCSAFHFQRVFSYMANTSVAEYIRRRRLTLAAVDLRSGEKVIDVAVKYGYNSPTAFSRAFAAFHGFTPSESKGGGVTFTSYPPISFQITVKGVTAMNYKIEKKGAIRVVGVKLTTTMDDEKNLREIPEFWTQCNQNGISMKIAALSGQEPFGLLGVCAGLPSNSGAFDYYIAASTDEPVPEEMTEYTIPAAEWAIFESVGALPNALQDLTRRIYTEWLPTSGYEYGSTADIEVYTIGDIDASDYKAEIWVPIMKRQAQDDTEKTAFTVKNCISCGMPMKESADFPNGDRSKDYCCHCARLDGTMQSFEEKQAGLAAFIVKTQRLDESEAFIAAESALMRQPAWQKQFS